MFVWEEGIFFCVFCFYKLDIPLLLILEMQSKMCVRQLWLYFHFQCTAVCVCVSLNDWFGNIVCCWIISEPWFTDLGHRRDNLDSVLAAYVQKINPSLTLGLLFCPPTSTIHLLCPTSWSFSSSSQPPLHCYLIFYTFLPSCSLPCPIPPSPALYSPSQ